MEKVAARVGLDAALDAVLCRYAQSSKESYLRAWQLWSDFINPELATALDANKFIDEYKRQIIQSKNNASRGLVPSRRTVQKLVLVLYSLHKQIFPDARNPFEALRRDFKSMQVKQRRPTQMLDYDKVIELIEAPAKFGPCGERDSVFFALLFGAALRISEAIKLNVDDIRITKKLTTIFLRETKNGDDIEMPLPDWAAEKLKKYIQNKKANEPLFCDFTGHYSGQGRRATRSTMYKRFKFWCKKIGLSHKLAPHAARATAITKLLDDGLAHRDVQQFSRHSSIAMVELYDKRRVDQSNHPAIKLSYKKMSCKK